MRSFLPPDTDDLRSKIVARNARRARALAHLLRARTEGTTLAREERATRRGALDLLGAVLRSVRGPAREHLLYTPGMRAWLCNAEEALALTDPAGSAIDLFERISTGPFLPRLLPRGRLDAGFRRRATGLGSEILERAFLKLPPLLAFLVPEGCRFGPFPLDLAPDAEEARVAGELHIGGPLPISLRLPPGTRLELIGAWPSRAGITGSGALPGQNPDSGIRAASPDSSTVGASALRLLARGEVRSQAREMIPGSAIVVARRVRWSRKGTVPGGSVRGAPARLGEALALLDSAWPEGGREVRAQTFEVIPLAEKATVSYSLPSRPGCSFINLHGKTIVDLADDLLHESAHHRLHGLEEIEGPLDRDDGEPRYWSPWRRSIRPVRGILHAAYTFTWRAGLLSRLLALDRRLPKSWIRRQRDQEIRMLEAAVRDLLEAGRLGLLTPAGASIVRAIKRSLGRMT